MKPVNHIWIIEKRYSNQGPWFLATTSTVSGFIVNPAFSTRSAAREYVRSLRGIMEYRITRLP